MLLVIFKHFHNLCLFILNKDDDQDQDSMKVLKELENIDDECDQNGIAFVKIGKFFSSNTYLSRP